MPRHADLGPGRLERRPVHADLGRTGGDDGPAEAEPSHQRTGPEPAHLRQEQSTTDETNLTNAQNQLAADEALGCPAASSSSSSGATGATGSATNASDTALTLTGTVDTGGSGHELLLRIRNEHRLRLHHGHRDGHAGREPRCRR